MQPPYRFRSFISYSHADIELAKRLHQWLERLQIPEGFAEAGQYLRPVFFDEEELGAGPLTRRLQEALDASQTLVVLVSSDSSSSHWVEQEILHFIGRRPLRPIIAVATSYEKRQGDGGTVLPKPLVDLIESRELGTDGNFYIPSIQHLGEEKAFYKTAAGILGTSPSVLFDRHHEEEQRRLRKIKRLTALPFMEAAAAALQSHDHVRALHLIAAGTLAAEDFSWENVPEFRPIAILAAVRCPAKSRQTKSPVTAIAFASDRDAYSFSAPGVCIAFATRFGTAEEPVKFGLLPDTVHHTELSRSGDVLLTLSAETCAVWNFRTREPIFGMADIPRSRVEAATLSVDGTVWLRCSSTQSPDRVEAATLSSDGAAVVWVTEEGSVRGTRLTGSGEVFEIDHLEQSSLFYFDVRLSSDGRFVIYWSARQIGILDTKTLETVWSMDEVTPLDLRLHRGNFDVLPGDESNDSLKIIGVNSGGGFVLGPLTISTLAEPLLPKDSGHALVGFRPPIAIGRRRNIACFSGFESSAKVFSLADGTIMTTLKGHEGLITSISLVNDDALALTTSLDGTTRLFDTVSGEQVAVLALSAEPHIKAVVSPDEQNAITVDGKWARYSPRFDDPTMAGDSATYISLGGKRPIQTAAPHQKYVFSIRESGDGRSITTASHDHTACILNAEDLSPRMSLVGHEGYVNSAAFSKDDGMICTASEDGTAIVWRAETGEMLRRLVGHSEEVCAAEFLPCGDILLTCSADGSFRIWDTESFACLQSVDLNAGLVNSCAFSPCSKYVAFACHDGTVRVWSLDPLACVAVLEDHNDRVVSVEFGADADTLVSASDDRTAIVWRVSDGKMHAHLKGHRDMVRSASFSKEGGRVVTASWDGIVRVFDTKSGAEVWSVSHHRPRETTVGLPELFWYDTKRATNARFMRDGNRVISCGWNGKVSIWDCRWTRLAEFDNGMDAVVCAMISGLGDVQDREDNGLLLSEFLHDRPDNRVNLCEEYFAAFPEKENDIRRMWKEIFEAGAQRT